MQASQTWHLQYSHVLLSFKTRQREQMFSSSNAT